MQAPLCLQTDKTIKQGLMLCVNLSSNVLSCLQRRKKRRQWWKASTNPVKWQHLSLRNILKCHLFCFVFHVTWSGKNVQQMKSLGSIVTKLIRIPLFKQQWEGVMNQSVHYHCTMQTAWRTSELIRVPNTNYCSVGFWFNDTSSIFRPPVEICVA